MKICHLTVDYDLTSNIKFKSENKAHKGFILFAMDNPGISLFKGDDINVNNSQNHEEEEDLEDQIRRREEVCKIVNNFGFGFNILPFSCKISLQMLWTISSTKTVP